MEKTGPPLAWLLTEPRETEAARRFLRPARRPEGGPETLTLDGRDAHAAALQRDREAHGPHLMMRQGPYVNTLVGQDHRAVPRVTPPMVGCPACAAAPHTRLGIELMHRRTKGQRVVQEDAERLTAAERVSSLAASSSYHHGLLPLPHRLNKICDTTKGLL